VPDFDQVVVKLCDVPTRCGLTPKNAKPDEESEQNDLVVKLGEPEVVVLGIRPDATTPSTILEAFESLFAKFGHPGTKDGQVLPSSLEIGSSVDLLSVRLLDFSAAATAVESSRVPSSIQQAFAAGLDALGQFRSFLHVVRRTGDNTVDSWWTPSESLASGPGRPTTLLCLRGEGVVSRFLAFLSKEWQLPAAIAGDVFFSPDADVAYRAYHAFFSHTSNFSKSSISPFRSSVPASDLRSSQRFMPAKEGVKQASYLAPRLLFPPELSPQLTVAVILPPCDDWYVNRVLTTVEQNGFALCTAVVSGGLSKATARILFEQEVADGHVGEDEWSTFQTATGCYEGEDDEERSFRAIWLVLSRHQAIKRLAQLCGHGDPGTNQRFLHKSLRMPPLQRLQNGIRCATSWSSAQSLLQALAADLAPRLATPNAGMEARLGVQACARTPECALIALAIPSDSEVNSISTLATLSESLAQRSLQIVALRTFSSKSAQSNWPPTGGLQMSSVQVQQWRESREGSAQFVDLATTGCDVILVACEGIKGIEHARAAAATLASVDSRRRMGVYVSASSSEAAADIVQFFDALFAAKHYVVDGGID